MKMKIYLLALFITGLTLKVQAQSTNAETEAMANLLGVQKKEVIKKLVPVTGKDSVAFWKIYEEYQTTNNKNIKSRIRLYERTAMAYANMTPGLADSLAQLYFVNRDENEKNLQLYYNKIKKSNNAVTAFEFYQAEIYLLTQLRAQIMQQVHTYGEVQRSIKKTN
ncbi:hypothetical protein [Solitalea lacus]|uniref:hypothetical protein n=1 Tax=Solitalea lacus TaxID=2911172 RepID=UPI001EDC7ED4|nr:hypothetical protein [Solitalea lacus]UKJ08438.1 hypothetical protein L2B55_04540 [Solitalea lacus]